MYCYKVTPFSLMNVGATYQRLVNMMFRDQIGKIMEVYVDDMLVKSKNDVNSRERCQGVIRVHNRRHGSSLE